MLAGIMQAHIRGASTGTGTGHARQVTVVSPAFGVIALNSGATQRQTTLPGTAENEGK